MFNSLTFKKTISVTLALIILNNAVLPGVAYALTSGPKRPESTSFEPIDTTDMLNLLSGDLAYNLPLIDVPGPEEGYPLSLSYHAAIAPDLEASWVGLGWTCNPGAIDRTVSGFPDDFTGQQNIARDYWDGGTRTTTSVGVNIGIYGPMGSEFGIVVAHDTFLGIGVGGYAGLNFMQNIVGPYGASVSLGMSIDPFGGTSLYVNGGIGATFSGKAGRAQLGVGFGEGGVSLDVGVGKGNAQLSANLNFNTLKAGAGVSLLGASINTNGQIGFMGAGISPGRSGVENSKAGIIQTRSSGWHIPIPTPIPGLSLSISHTYERYWSDETSSIQTFGTLHYPATRGYNFNREYDSYYLADINDPNYNLTTNSDPIKSTGGTLPDYDTYSVSGQGISGYVRPFGYQLEICGKGANGMDGSLWQTNRQNVVDDPDYEYGYDPNTNDYIEYIIHNYTYYNNNPAKLYFRFVNDFSNRYDQQDINNSSSSMQFDLNPTYGLNDGTNGFDPNTGKLASSRNIEYFTNDEIKSGSAQLKGFIDTHAAGFDRTKNPNGSSINASQPDQRIGGFMITNESGVTYHYALPVYSYNEYTKTENISGVTTFNEQTRPDPYATSWILTAITGPDYVDANHNGKVDSGDWGYWVDFEYGKWADNYGWRTPYTGTDVDLDQRFQSHSGGNKELYYIDAIITPSHTAIFSKEMRTDGKGVQSDGSGKGPQNAYPTAQLRLNDIILYNNADLNLSIDQIRNRSTNYNQVLQGSIIHHGENVIDINDVNTMGSLASKILRDVRFNYDYSLCPQTPNSYDPTGTAYQSSGTFNPASLFKYGKLSLRSISFLGKQAQASIPPTAFDYELPSDQVKQSSTIAYQGPKDSYSGVYLFQDASGIFSEGDIVTFNQSGNTYYGIIKAVDVAAGSNNVLEVKFINNTPSSLSGTYGFSSTKNPPYSSDDHDIWGMYKADYIGYTISKNLSRLPSRASAKASDVWSLRRIHQPLGMSTDIVYEPDTYSKVALYQNASIIVNSVNSLNDGASFQVNTTPNFGIDLRDFITVGSKVQLTVAGNYQVENVGQDGNTGSYYYQGVSLSSGNTPTLLVTQVSANSVVLSDANFYDKIFNDPNGTAITGGNMSAGGLGNNYGGGLRVKQIVNKEPVTGVTMIVSYNYNIPATPTLSSGTTSYEPVGPDLITARGYSDPYNIAVGKNFSNLLGLTRLVPAPSVMYEYVSVSASRIADGQTVNQIGRSQYQFEVFNKGMIGIWNENPIKNGTWNISNILIQNNTSRIGSLKKIIKYDDKGNKLSETINHYLYDEQTSESAQSNRDQYETLLNKFNKQGVIKERTIEGRYNNSAFHFVATLNNTYPNIPTGSTSIDYKTGLISNTQTLGYDFYSGQSVKSLTYDSYGNRFISETTPAYLIYPQMGLKFNNSLNANMLSQVAQQVTYTADANNNYTGIVSASATTWSNQTTMLNDQEQAVNTLTANTRVTTASNTDQLNIWRPYQTYQWMPADRTGGTTTSGFLSFFTGGASLASWLKASEITLYNLYSNAIEAKDINGNYGATKMGYSQSKVVATASNANYSEMTYAGLEDGTLSNGSLPRGMNLGSATIVNSISHTGYNSAQINSGQSGLYYSVSTNNLKTNRNYMASVWMNTNGDPTQATMYYKVNGGTPTLATVYPIKKAGQWYLVTLQIPGGSINPNGTLEIGCVNNGSSTAYFDDFRFKPLSSAMTSYVYDTSTGELTYILDGNNMFAQFQYDSEGRLTKTFKENFGYGVKQVSENQYHYANQ